MTNKEVKVTCLVRGPGEAGVEQQGNQIVGYGRDQVVVRIGNSFMAVDASEFEAAVVKEDEDS